MYKHVNGQSIRDAQPNCECAYIQRHPLTPATSMPPSLSLFIRRRERPIAPKNKQFTSDKAGCRSKMHSPQQVAWSKQLCQQIWRRKCTFPYFQNLRAFDDDKCPIQTHNGNNDSGRLYRIKHLMNIIVLWLAMTHIAGRRSKNDSLFFYMIPQVKQLSPSPTKEVEGGEKHLIFHLER